MSARATRSLSAAAPKRSAGRRLAGRPSRCSTFSSSSARRSRTCAPPRTARTCAPSGQPPSRHSGSRRTRGVSRSRGRALRWEACRSHQRCGRRTPSLRRAALPRPRRARAAASPSRSARARTGTAPCSECRTAAAVGRSCGGGWSGYSPRGRQPSARWSMLTRTATRRSSTATSRSPKQSAPRSPRGRAASRSPSAAPLRPRLPPSSPPPPRRSRPPPLFLAASSRRAA
mmetsp:Transcript_9049/g.29090  ORF Transcript_9049/g.29090 Transcript_9049/m.29090 type:complete len:230 (-) Transcript_9049:188-877(-)